MILKRKPCWKLLLVRQVIKKPVNGNGNPSSQNSCLKLFRSERGHQLTYNVEIKYTSCEAE